MDTIETLESPFKHLVMTIGELPTTFVESMSYYEALAWLVDYMEKTLLPAVNNNAEVTKELQAAYIELKEYVENYFSDLNIQNEVNNKLDDMAEQGELADIIAQYLNLQAVLAFDTEADLAAASNVVNGSICRTIGKTTYDDGDGYFFKVRELEEGESADGETLIAITGTDLVAERITNKAVDDVYEKIGSLSDLDTTDKDNVVDAINELKARKFFGLRYEPLNIYIDDASGDDTNDGLSTDHPKKTINNAIETYGNDGFNVEFRLYLKPATYDFRVFNMSDISLHIGAYGNNGTTIINMINPNSERFDVAFYACHIAINGSSTKPFVINFVNADGLYGDGIHFSATYTTFNGKIGTIGGDSSFGNCFIPSIRVARAGCTVQSSQLGFIDLDNANFSAWQCSYLTYVDKTTYSTNNTNDLIAGSNSNIRILGNSQTRYYGTPPMTNFMNLAGCQLTVQAALNPNASDTLVPFTGSIILNSCVVMSTAVRWTALTQNATTTTISDDSIKSSTIS